MGEENRLTFLNQKPATGPDSVAGMVTFLGACFDGGSSKPGPNQAPDAVRRISEKYANTDGSAHPCEIYNPERGFLVSRITFCDAGNVVCGSDIAGAVPLIEQAVKEILERNSLPVIIGGDHFVTYPCVKAYTEKMTVIHFDAHSDFLDRSIECPHGSVMRMVHNLGHVKQIIHCGLRGNLSSKPDIDDSINMGNLVFHTSDLIKNGKELLEQHLPQDEPVYITFDVDVLDPSVCPGTGTIEPEGISYALARELLTLCVQRCRLKGIDFVEYNPLLDWNDMSGTIINNLIYEILGAARLCPEQ